MQKIVISYRRADSAWTVRSIFDRLAAHYGTDSVFMDIDAIPLGSDFREHIEQALREAGLVVAVIGPDWVGARKRGLSRINDEDDPVRIELEMALRRGIPIIPVLANRATMPKADDLPDSLREFTFHNAAEVDAGRDFDQQMARLIKSMDRLFATKSAEKDLKRETGMHLAHDPRTPVAETMKATPHERAPFMSRGVNQEIKYCRAADGVRLAYSTVGQGPVLLRTAHWLNHLQHDWDNAVWGPMLRGLAEEHTLIRCDARGNGLSDWEVADISFDVWVSDLETVVEAAGVKRFALLGVSQSCSVSIAYAVRHPERVSRLILYGGFALGACLRSPVARERHRAMATLVRLEWGADNPIIRQIFGTEFVPDAPKDLFDSFNEWQRLVTSGECAARYLLTVGEIDVRDLLPKVAVPTLVMHRRGDMRVPFEEGRQMAAAIPGARFIALDGRNHIPLEDEPAFERFFEEIKLFLNE
jgi:pimeloyl-ACP methyl ester carboxylesterase